VKKANIRVGISGWRYPGWRGTFYPKNLVQRRELEFASRQINSIEINGTFYSLQTKESYQRWYDSTPADFVFAVKGSRYITHIKQLRSIEEPLKTFFSSGVLSLEEKLGPILWQFPPRMRWDEEKFSHFFSLLPKWNTDADPKFHGKKRRLRYAVEIRNESFLTPEFFNLLRKYKIAFVFADTAGKWPYKEEITTDFIYMRLHGDEKIYVSGYTEAALNRWAGKIEKWRKQGINNFYVYFDNDVKVRAPFDAQSLYKKAS
jgi:uncharacterized protein YecE (DUF72 family)